MDNEHQTKGDYLRVVWTSGDKLRRIARDSRDGSLIYEYVSAFDNQWTLICSRDVVCADWLLEAINGLSSSLDKK